MEGLSFSKVLPLKDEEDWHIDKPPFFRSLTVSRGITVSTLKKTSMGNVEGGDSFETTEMGRSKNFSFPEFWNNLIDLHSIRFVVQHSEQKDYELRTNHSELYLRNHPLAFLRKDSKKM